VNVRDIPLSASQVKAWDDGEGGGCHAAWAATYIAKLPRSESGGTRAGTKVHGRIEAYLRDGTGIDSGEVYQSDGKAYRIGDCALGIAKHLPPAGTVPADRVERPFLLTVLHDGKRYVFRGGIDLYDPPIWPDAKKPPAQLYDHKSTRGLGYVPKVDKLKRDIQVAMYVIVYLAHVDGTDTYTIGQGSPTDTITCQWTYGSTADGASRPVRFAVTRAEAEAVFLEKILPTADKIYDAYMAAADWRTHDKNLGSCGSYGGCPRVKDCAPSATQRGLKMLTREQLMAKIKAKSAGAAVDPTPAPVDPQKADPPPVSRLERIRADAARINRPDTAAATGKVADPTPVEAPETVAEPDPIADAPPIPVADLPAPAGETPPDPPKRRGRPRKTSIAGPDGTGSATGTADLVTGADTTPAVPVKESTYEERELPEIAADGYTLYIDCHPIRASVTYAHDLIARSAVTVRDDAGVPDIGLIDYGKGPSALAAQLRSDLSDNPVTGALVTTKYTPEGKATLQVLIEGAREVVMAH
jgi:hypothetical protein